MTDSSAAGPRPRATREQRYARILRELEGKRDGYANFAPAVRRSVAAKVAFVIGVSLKSITDDIAVLAGGELLRIDNGNPARGRASVIRLTEKGAAWLREHQEGGS